MVDAIGSNRRRPRGRRPLLPGNPPRFLLTAELPCLCPSTPGWDGNRPPAQRVDHWPHVPRDSTGGGLVVEGFLQTQEFLLARFDLGLQVLELVLDEAPVLLALLISRGRSARDELPGQFVGLKVRKGPDTRFLTRRPMLGNLPACTRGRMTCRVAESILMRVILLD